MHTLKGRFLAFSLCLATACVGCVSVRGRTIPEAPRTRRTFQHGPKRIKLSLEFQTNGNPNTAGVALLMGTVLPVLQGCGLFSNVSTDSDARAPYELKVTVNNIATGGALAVAVLTGIFSGLTLTLLPAYARDWYEMTATLYRNGKEVATYRFKDYKSTWIEFFLLFAMPFRSLAEPLKQTIRNMTWHLVAGLHRDLSRWDAPGVDQQPSGPIEMPRPRGGGGETLRPDSPGASPPDETPPAAPPRPRGEFPSPDGT